MEHSIRIGDLAEQLFKVYNQARPDNPAQSCKVDFFIIPVLKFKDDLPKHDIDLEDCKLRFKFSVMDFNNPPQSIFDVNLDVQANKKITYTNIDGETVDFKDCVKEISLATFNPTVRDKAFKFYGNPVKLNVNLSAENSDIKYHGFLSKAFNKCVEKIDGKSK